MQLVNIAFKSLVIHRFLFICWRNLVGCSVEFPTVWILLFPGVAFNMVLLHYLYLVLKTSLDKNQVQLSALLLHKWCCILPSRVYNVSLSLSCLFFMCSFSEFYISSLWFLEGKQRGWDRGWEGNQPFCSCPGYCPILSPCFLSEPSLWGHHDNAKVLPRAGWGKRHVEKILVGNIQLLLLFHTREHQV